MAGQTLRELIVSVTADTGSYQREMARAGRMGTSYFKTISEGNKEAVSGWRSQQAAIRAQDTAMQSLKTSVTGYAQAMAGALAVGNLIHMADEWGQVNSRIRLATGSQEEYEQAQKSLMSTADNTFKKYTDVAELFIRSNKSLKEYGATTDQVAKITDAFAGSLVVSGANAQMTESAMSALSKVFETGKFGTDDLQSLQVNGARIITALTNSLGVGQDKLREMVSTGKVSSRDLANALLKDFGTIRKEVELMPTSVADAMTQLYNHTLEWVGGANEASGATRTLADGIKFLAANLDTAGIVATTAAIGMLANKSIQASAGAITQAKNWRTNSLAMRETARAAMDATAAMSAKATADAAEAAANIRLARTAVDSATQRQLDLTLLTGQMVAQKELAASTLASAQANAVRARSVDDAAQADMRAAVAAEAAGRGSLTGNTGAIAARQAAEQKAAAASLERAAADRSLVAAEEAVSVADARAAASTAGLADARKITTLATKELDASQKAGIASAALDAKATDVAAVAKRNYAAASSLAATAGRGLLGILGGPAGIATLAVTAGASWLLFRDNTNQATEGLIDMKAPLDEVIAKFKTLTAVQQENVRIETAGKLASARKSSDRAYDVAGLSAATQVTMIPLDEFSQPYISPKNQLAVDTFQGSIDKLKDSTLPVTQLSAALKEAVEQFVSSTGASASQRKELLELVGVAEKAKSAHQDLEQQLSALDKTQQAVSGSAGQLGKDLNAGAPSDKTIESWKKYNEQLAERLAKAKDPSNLGEANRGIAADKVDQYAPEVAAERRRLAAQLDASDAAKKAQDESERRSKQVADEADRRSKQVSDRYAQQLQSLTQQNDMFGKTTELQRVRYELSNGELRNFKAIAGAAYDSKVQALERAAIESDNLRTQEQYRGMVQSLRTQDEQRLDLARERLAILEKERGFGKIPESELRDQNTRISKGLITEAPEFGGLHSSVGGASGEMVKVAQAKAVLQKWHEEQIAMQSKLRDQILADENSSYEQRLAAEQQYLDRVKDINDANSKRLSTIQDSYKVAVIGTFSELSGQAADMVGKIAGEQSGAYKALFVAQKAFAVASIIMNAQIAAAKAPAELTILGGIPVGAALLAAGYANAGMVAGMALAGFSEGGYTGPGGKFEPKGVVHGGEVVIRKEVVDQPGMKDYLIGLNRSGKPGYASGGFVGSPGISPAFTAPAVATGTGPGAAPEIHLHINGDGSGGTVNSPEGYEQMGIALLATARSEMPKIARQVILQEKGQNGLLDPNNRRNS